MFKKTILFALLAAPLAAAAQQFKVVGAMPEGATTVYLRNMQLPRGQQPDSVQLKDCTGGRFTFEGDTEGRMFARIYTNRPGNDAMTVVLDGTVNVDIDKKTAKGTTENKLLGESEKTLQPLAARRDSLMTLLRDPESGKDSVRGARLIEEYGQAANAYGRAVLDICRTHRDRIFPAVLLPSVLHLVSQDEVLAVADLQPAFLKVSYVKHLNSLMAGWRRQAVGVMFTDLEMPDTTGTMHKLSEYVGRGNYVLVDFWASWCGPCMAELPNVLEAYNKYHAKGFDVVGLSFDGDRAAWVNAINTKQIPWHHLSDLKGWSCLAGQVYGVRAIPQTLLIGPDGKIVAAGLRDEGLKNKLREIYGE